MAPRTTDEYLQWLHMLAQHRANQRGMGPPSPADLEAVAAEAELAAGQPQQVYSPTDAMAAGIQPLPAQGSESGFDAAPKFGEWEGLVGTDPMVALDAWNAQRGNQIADARNWLAGGGRTASPRSEFGTAEQAPWGFVDSIVDDTVRAYAGAAETLVVPGGQPAMTREYQEQEGIPDQAALAAALDFADPAMLGSVARMPKGMVRALGRWKVPMDEASRAARATLQGFGEPRFHGTSRADELVESGAFDTSLAKEEGLLGPAMPYTTSSGEHASKHAAGGEGAGVIPLRVRNTNPLVLEASMTKEEAERIFALTPDPDMYSFVQPSGTYAGNVLNQLQEVLGTRQANEVLRKAGYTGFAGEASVGGGTSVDVLFDPDDARSLYDPFVEADLEKAVLTEAERPGSTKYDELYSPTAEARLRETLPEGVPLSGERWGFEVQPEGTYARSAMANIAGAPPGVRTYADIDRLASEYADRIIQAHDAGVPVDWFYGPTAEVFEQIARDPEKVVILSKLNAIFSAGTTVPGQYNFGLEAFEQAAAGMPIATGKQTTAMSKVANEVLDDPGRDLSLKIDPFSQLMAGNKWVEGVNDFWELLGIGYKRPPSSWSAKGAAAASIPDLGPEMAPIVERLRDGKDITNLQAEALDKAAREKGYTGRNRIKLNEKVNNPAPTTLQHRFIHDTRAEALAKVKARRPEILEQAAGGERGIAQGLHWATVRKNVGEHANEGVSDIASLIPKHELHSTWESRAGKEFTDRHAATIQNPAAPLTPDQIKEQHGRLEDVVIKDGRDRFMEVAGGSGFSLQREPERGMYGVYTPRPTATDPSPVTELNPMTKSRSQVPILSEDINKLAKARARGTEAARAGTTGQDVGVAGLWVENPKGNAKRNAVRVTTGAPPTEAQAQALVEAGYPDIVHQNDGFIILRPFADEPDLKWAGNTAAKRDEIQGILNDPDAHLRVGGYRSEDTYVPLAWEEGYTPGGGGLATMVDELKATGTYDRFNSTEARQLVGDIADSFEKAGVGPQSDQRFIAALRVWAEQGLPALEVLIKKGLAPVAVLGVLVAMQEGEGA